MTDQENYSLLEYNILFEQLLVTRVVKRYKSNTVRIRFDVDIRDWQLSCCPAMAHPLPNQTNR